MSRKMMRVFRGERPILPHGMFATDPGDFGRGIYFTTALPRARAIAGTAGKVVKMVMDVSEFLLIDMGEAYRIADAYGTVDKKFTVEEKMRNAQAMRDELVAEGFKGLIAVRKDRAGRVMEREVVQYVFERELRGDA